jgi:hypothetical protein
MSVWRHVRQLGIGVSSPKLAGADENEGGERVSRR